MLDIAVVQRVGTNKVRRRDSTPEYGAIDGILREVCWENGC